MDLYATAARLLYHDRDKKKAVEDPIYGSLTRKEKERLLSYVAYQFVKNNKTKTGNDGLAAMIMKSRNDDESAANVERAKALAGAFVLRSGVLNEVGANDIQFLHKTFQEYFGAVEAVYRQDEMHVAKHFDLKSWGEMYLSMLSLAPGETAAEMVAVTFERSQSKEKDWLAYLLLAGAGCREVGGVQPQLKQSVMEEVGNLFPPSDAGIVYQLSDLGDLVIPFLSWNPGYSAPETDRILTLLGLINEDGAKNLMEEYAKRARIQASTLECFIRGLEYKADRGFAGRIFEHLRARNSSYFYKSRPRRRLYVGTKSLLRHTDLLPEVGWLVLDGRGGLSISDALGSEWKGTDRIKRISIISAGELVGSKFERFDGLEEVDFVESFVDDAEFLSFASGVKVLRLIDSELANWESLEYGGDLKLYMSGKSVGEALYHEGDMIRQSVATLYVGMDSIRGMEMLGGAKGDFDTWGIELWREEEIAGLKRELGIG